MWQRLVTLADVFRIGREQEKNRNNNYKLTAQILVGVVVMLALLAGYWRAKYIKLEEQIMESSL